MDLTGFRESLSGALFASDQEQYDALRQLWNASIDKRPWGVLQCADTSDVQRAIAYATDNDLAVAVRGCGHHAAGFGSVDDGLVIDLSRMNRVAIDVPNKTARAGPGVAAGLFQRTAQESGLFLPVGTVSTVGLAGLTLGGGQGWFTSKYGLTCDNLVSAEIVTASGDLVHADEAENADLFWGLRGGGGNFGVAVSLEYQVHALSEVVAGTIAYPMASARDVIRNWRDRIVDAPDDLGSMAIFVGAPEPMVLIAVCYAGSQAMAQSVLQPFSDYGHPSLRAIDMMSVVDLGGMFDGASLPGSGNYWRSHRFRELSDDAVAAFVEQCRGATSNESMAWFGYFGAGLQRIAPTDTAYAHRTAPFEMGISARWPIDDDDVPHMAWANTFWATIAPHATGDIYANWSSDPTADSSASAYGVNLARLQDVKQKFDPRNVFRQNFNVVPAGA